ncbi:hypothetical protein Ga0080559_TMP4322 [Salipiger profundus]|uniref:Uncharacterized protein n=1 Tax=Salipiger profundus TaxID=1229727 RepID=A0A1U7DAH9_9RHOB|nr:hypothetical protein Ga0080559_TMP4322 [Salipiger profundus]
MIVHCSAPASRLRACPDGWGVIALPDPPTNRDFSVENRRDKAVDDTVAPRSP